MHDTEWPERDLFWLPCHQGKKFTPSSYFANAILKSIISPSTSIYSLFHPSNHLSYWISVHLLHHLLFIKNSLCAWHWGGKILTVSVTWTQALRLPIIRTGAKGPRVFRLLGLRSCGLEQLSANFNSWRAYLKKWALVPTPRDLDSVDTGSSPRVFILTGDSDAGGLLTQRAL